MNKYADTSHMVRGVAYDEWGRPFPVEETPQHLLDKALRLHRKKVREERRKAKNI